jgi:Flp pilus assembly protein TadG
MVRPVIGSVGTRVFTRLVSFRRGSVSVEAAVLFPVLITLVMGTIEFGMLIFTYSAMQTAAREVTRQVAVNFADAASAQDLIAERLPGWAADGARVTVNQSAPANPESNVITLTVTMPVESATPIRLLTLMSEDWDLRSQVAMKQELPL